jgi:hypothetical protein
MHWSIENVAKFLLIVAILSGWTLSEAPGVWAQEKGGTLAQQIQGSWILVSIYNEQEGKKIDVFGPKPRGFMTFTPDGRFMYILMRANLPKFASNNRMKGTAEENQAVIQGSHATFGKYNVVVDKEQTVNLHIEGSTFPNWDGQDQKRVMTVIGDELKITNPNPSFGGGKNYVVLKRAK